MAQDFGYTGFLITLDGHDEVELKKNLLPLVPKIPQSEWQPQEWASRKFLRSSVMYINGTVKNRPEVEVMYLPSCPIISYKFLHSTAHISAKIFYFDMGQTFFWIRKYAKEFLAKYQSHCVEIDKSEQLSSICWLKKWPGKKIDRSRGKGKWMWIKHILINKISIKYPSSLLCHKVLLQT